MLLHWLLFLVMAARLSSDVLRLLQVDIPPIIQELNLPTARLWELAWQPSILASIFAQLSLKRNNVSLLWQAMLGEDNHYHSIFKTETSNPFIKPLAECRETSTLQSTKHAYLRPVNQTLPAHCFLSIMSCIK